MIAHRSPSAFVSERRAFEHRLSLLLFASLVAFVGLGYRLWVKSVVEHGNYRALATNQHTIRQDLPATRGVIYAHDGDALFPIATNERRYDVSVIPNRVTDAQALAEAVAPLLGLDQSELVQKFATKRPYLPPLTGHRPVDRATALKLLDLKQRSLTITPVEARTYPEGDYASQLLGFINFEGQGSYGIESRYDDALQGKSGTLLGQKDTFGRLVSVTGQVEAQPGSSLVLTLDHTIQFIAERSFKQAITKYGAGGGTVIVMNPVTGAVKALANAPSFDPNRFNEVPSDEQSRYLNAATSAVYEPGSVFKPIIMATALNEGVVAPETTGVFSNFVTVQGYDIHTALDKAYGESTMTQVLENSDNVGMVWVASHLEYQTLYDSLKRFGLGQPTGVDLPSETNGSLLPVKDWRDIHRATMAFGQGVSVTPLELVAAWSSLLNGGKLMKPYVVDRIIRANGDVVEMQPTEVRETIKPETSATIRAMLQSVVDHGQSKKAQIPGYTVGGKTGTAQIANPEGGYYDDQWNHTFMGFFPVESPEYLVFVKLDHPTASKFADGTALPTFVDIARGIITSSGLPPTREVSD